MHPAENRPSDPWQIVLEVIADSPEKQELRIEEFCSGDSARASRAKALLTAIGRRLVDRYEIVKHLGRGGYGYVFLAEDAHLHRRLVVLKLPTRVDEHLRSAETEALVGLHHDNIVVLHDAPNLFVDGKGVPILVMEYIEGQSLYQRLGTFPPLSFREVARVIADTASALDYAHQRGVVHRDIKPANVLLRRSDGRLKIVDFGIAKVLRGGHTSVTAIRPGTDRYLAPEYLESGRINARIDQYSLAVVAEEMIGKTDLAQLRPFEGAWLNVIARAKHHDAGQRYASCGEFAKAFSDSLHREFLAQLKAVLQRADPSPEVHIEPNIPQQTRADARAGCGLSATAPIVALVEIDSPIKVGQMRRVLDSAVVFTDDGCHVFGRKSHSGGKERLRTMVPYSAMAKAPTTLSFRKEHEYLPGIGGFDFYLFTFRAGEFYVAWNGALPFAVGEGRKVERRLISAQKVITSANSFVREHGAYSVS